MTTTSVMVGMAEIQVVKGSGVFSCLGLGSCIGVCILDPVANVGGCAHIMLPESFADKLVDKPGKFANTGIPELLAMMERMGADRSRLKVALAGGAQVFRFGAESSTSKLDIGARNQIAIVAALQMFGLKPIASDVGGNNGRTVTFDVTSGGVSVRTAITKDSPLANLRR